MNFVKRGASSCRCVEGMCCVRARARVPFSRPPSHTRTRSPFLCLEREDPARRGRVWISPAAGRPFGPHHKFHTRNSTTTWNLRVRPHIPSLVCAASSVRARLPLLGSVHSAARGARVQRALLPPRQRRPKGDTAPAHTRAECVRGGVSHGVCSPVQSVQGPRGDTAPTRNPICTGRRPAACDGRRRTQLRRGGWVRCDARAAAAVWARRQRGRAAGAPYRRRRHSCAQRCMAPYITRWLR